MGGETGVVAKTRIQCLFRERIVFLADEKGGRCVGGGGPGGVRGGLGVDLEGGTGME